MKILKDAFSIFRGGERQPDPRMQQFARERFFLGAKLGRLTREAEQRVDVTLTHSQSATILPAVKDAANLKISILKLSGIANVPDDEFVLQFERGGEQLMQLDLWDRQTQLTREVKQARSNWLKPTRRQHIAQETADTLGKKLEAVAFGHRVADALLRLQDDSPQSFDYV